MNTITRTENVTLSDDTRVIVMDIHHRGVNVMLDDLHRPNWNRYDVDVPWAQITDVDFLYKEFDEEAVRVFKQICEMLALINNNKHIYEGLMA
jgi:hypothetical protein